MTNAMVVTYGLIGIAVPTAMRMPPTIETNANTTDRTGTHNGEALTLVAAAAGTQSSASTSSAPTTWTDSATAQPSSSMNTEPSARVGTPRATATSASRLANMRGRQITASTPRTSTEVATISVSRAASTATI